MLANGFLGVQQGICWSCAVLMMVDRADAAHKSVAVGLNETAGYTASAVWREARRA